MYKLLFICTSDVSAIESLFQQYQQDENSVDASWRDFFKGFEFARTSYNGEGAVIPENISKEFKVITLINGYRQRGHLFTQTNPVRERRHYSPTLDVENFGLSQTDLETVFQAGTQIGIGAAKLKDIIAHLHQTYCQSIGAEYMYIRDPNLIKWMQEKMEAC